MCHTLLCHTPNYQRKSWSDAECHTEFCMIQSVILAVKQSVILFFQWRRVAYYSRNVIPQGAGIPGPSSKFVLFVTNPNHMIIQGFLGPPKSNLWVHEQTSALWYYQGLEFWEDYQTPLVIMYVLFFSFKVPQRGYPQTPLVPSSQNLWFINRAVVILLFFSAQPSISLQLGHTKWPKHQNVQKLTSVCPEDLIDTPWPYVNLRKRPYTALW